MFLWELDPLSLNQCSSNGGGYSLQLAFKAVTKMFPGGRWEQHGQKGGGGGFNKLKIEIVFLHWGKLTNLENGKVICFSFGSFLGNRLERWCIYKLSVVVS